MAAHPGSSDQPLLLVVFPGAPGRKSVLQQLLSIARLCILVSSDDPSRSLWARALVGSDCWIEAPGVELTDMWASVSEWLERTGIELDGVLCYDEFGVEVGAMLCDKLSLPGCPLQTMQVGNNLRTF